MVLFCGDNNIANPASINVAAAAAATSTGEDYDLTDAEQWMEFAARFESIKETVGGDPVRAALQFP
eukprot:scaffold39085_cov230-Skeletonema_marinoi.AAC.1